MRRLTVLGLTLAVGLLTLPAADAGPAHRTVRLTANAAGAPIDAAVSEAVYAGSANAAAFVSTSSTFTDDPNGDVPDVMAIDIPSGRRRLVSHGYDGTGANGPSSSPAISASGLSVAFVSDASNLVPDDTNGQRDVFVAAHDGSIVRASIAVDGSEANGPSSQPDLSRDGHLVVFTSSASNLVPDDTNGQADVFLRDLTRGTTRRISVAAGGAQGTGTSGAPAISDDGTTVAYESSSKEIVAGDANGVADVFVRDSGGGTERISISSSGKQQDKAITAPYVSTPDISANGRYVVFDSDATTLYAGDKNKRTDVYLRDRRKKTTTLVSASSLNVQGNNDSVTPQISANGRFVSFQSFATNLTPDDAPGEDLFIRDLRSGTTSLINATDSGARRDREPGGQLLQRALIADDGRSAIFLSAAPNVLTPSAASPVQLYYRNLTAPMLDLSGAIVRKKGRVQLRFTTDDPAAKRFLCRVDLSQPYYCSARVNVRATAGRVLSVRAGGPGMLWSAAQSVVLNSG
jgi:Tol biopolymer transport system component